MKHQIEAVYEVLERYMEGTYTADIPMLESVFHQEARMTGYLGDQLIMGTPAPFLEDMGKVIGKQGRVAKAIRTVVKAAALNEDRKAVVEIIDVKS